MEKPVEWPASRVIIESPYKGDVEKNVAYAKLCMHHSLNRKEAPIASHLLYTQKGILDDNNEEERLIGMEAGFAWLHVADLVAVYTDLGITDGMKKGIAMAREKGIPVMFRKLTKTTQGDDDGKV